MQKDNALFWYTQPLEVRFRDTDGLGHVNNAVYLTYFEMLRVSYGLQLIDGERLEDVQFILGEATVRYLKPVFYGDTIMGAVRVSRLGGKSFTMQYELRRGDELVTSGTTDLVWFDYASQRSIPLPDTFRQRVREIQGEELEP